MNTNCALCGIPLTSMDTVLGENKLSDGGILCNKCLNKATNINKDLVYDLVNYSLVQIRDIVLGGNIVGKEEEEVEIQQEPIIKASVTRTVVTFSDSLQLNVSKQEKSIRLDEIKDQMNTLPTQFSIFVNNEVNELAHILDKNERLIAIAEGKYVNRNLDGILISTEHRVIFIDKEPLGDVTENEFPHHQIVSIQHSYGLISSELKIFTNEGIKAEFKLQNRNAAKTFYEAIQNYVYSPKNRLNQQGYQSIKEDADSIFEKLEKLGKLKESGILTGEEFEEQKKKLLDKL